MNSTAREVSARRSPAPRIPPWAAELVAGLSRDQPAVVTREEITQRLHDLGSSRETDATIRALGRLGWLIRLGRAGTWAFVPPGHDNVNDPYLAVRAWRATEPRSRLHLAGENAAWHLGYLDRSPHGKVRIWLPRGVRLPDGLRSHVRTVRVAWDADQVADLGPTSRLLVTRRLDIVSWSSGLPTFGPEALLVQLASRPSSFDSWADLVAHLRDVVDDVNDLRLKTLLRGQSMAAWQRAAYFLHAGGSPQRGIEFFRARPRGQIPKTHLGPPNDDQPSLYVADYGLIDRLIAPLQGLVGKA